MKGFIRMPSPAMVVAVAALVVALGGSAWAVSKIGTNQIKNRAVTSPKIRNGAVTTPRIANRAITARKVGKVPTVILNWTRPVTNIEDEFDFPLFNGWTEQLDNANMWPSADGGVVAPLDGLYRVDAQVIWSPNAIGVRRVTVRNFDSPDAALQVGSIVSGDNGDAVQYAGGLMRAEAGDRLFVYVWQDSGSTLSVGNNAALAGGTRFSVQYAGPAG